MADQIDKRIGEELRRIVGAGQKRRFPVMSGVVQAINEDGTCSVQLTSGAEDTPTDGILLNVVTENVNGLYLVPAANADCLVAEVDGPGQLKQLLWASKYTEVRMTVGSSKLSVKDGLMQFNDGSLGGMVKVAALTAKLNNLENIVNDLVAKYNTHTHILTLTSGTGTAAPTVTEETGTLTPTEQSDIENTAVKQ